MVTRVSTNCKISISNAAAAETIDEQAEFEGLTYLPIGQILNLGEFGDQANVITAAYLDSGRVEKYKGTRNAGQMDLELGYDPDNDTGQAQLIVAEQSPNNYAFKVELDDAGENSPSSNTTFYFRGQVMSRRVAPGSSDSVVTLNCGIEVNSAIITVDAV
jgi:hypothetical protein